VSQITEHLSEKEYFCKCGCGAPPDYDPTNMPPAYDYLFDCFEGIRAAWGKPLVVNSGYRCLRRNKAVGGGDLSAHLFGLAFDIQLSSPEEVGKFVDCVKDNCPDLRIGWGQYQKEGKNIVHIDNAWSVSPRPTRNFAEGVEW